VPAPAAAGTATASPARTAEPELDWGPVENGWLAARQFSELVKEHLTESGLPKRSPRARLLPGSIGGSKKTEERPERPRDADAVRGRLADYQRGLRHGRYAQAAGGEPDLAEQHTGSTQGQGSE
jgi:hypothetical protein